jgi:multiple sugar transport system substrate-binding protein
MEDLMPSHTHRALRTRSGVAVLGAGTLLVTALAACTPSTGGSDTSGGKPKTMHMLYATAEADAAAVQSLVPAFRQKFGIDLQIDTQPYDALQQKVFSESASGSSYYDIVIVDTPWAPALVGKLEPLSTYLNDPKRNDMAKTDIGDFIPKVFYDTAVYDAKTPAKHYQDSSSAPDTGAITKAGFDVYGLPIQANALVMAYRKDMFNDPKHKAAYQAATGKPLAVPRTWDEYTKVAKYFTQPAKGLYGTTVMAGVGDWATDDFKSLLASYGGNGHLVGDDLSLQFDTPEGVAALQYYSDLINKDKVVPPGSTSASWDETASLFDSGKTAMTMNYHPLALDSKVKGEIGYATVPEGKSTGPHFGTWMLGINKNSVNKDWAYRAITWLTAAEQQVTMTKKELHPTRTSVYKQITGSGETDASLKNFYQVLGDSLAVGVGRARLTNYTEVSNAIAKAVNVAASGSKTPQAALDGAATEVRRLLTEAGYKVPSS